MSSQHESCAIKERSKADNTVRENKNNGCMKMMTTLLQKEKMNFCSLLFPRVGHSHGALGSLIARSVSFASLATT